MTVCRLPDGIDFEAGAAMMLKGWTACYLLHCCTLVGGLARGGYVLFHAAAGGVGLIATQWAKSLGLRLIGSAGSDEKCAQMADALFEVVGSGKVKIPIVRPREWAPGTPGSC